MDSICKSKDCSDNDVIKDCSKMRQYLDFISKIFIVIISKVFSRNELAVHTWQALYRI